MSFGGTGPCDFLDPAGQLVQAKLDRLEKAIHAYEAQLRIGCKRFHQCRFDGGAFGRIVEKREYFSSDLNHFSIAGHAEAAAVAWTAMQHVGHHPGRLTRERLADGRGGSRSARHAVETLLPPSRHRVQPRGRLPKRPRATVGSSSPPLGEAARASRRAAVRVFQLPAARCGGSCAAAGFHSRRIISTRLPPGSRWSR